MQKSLTGNKYKSSLSLGVCRACFAPQRTRPFELESIRLLNPLQNSNSGRYCVLSHSNSIIIIIEFPQPSTGGESSLKSGRVVGECVFIFSVSNTKEFFNKWETCHFLRVPTLFHLLSDIITPFIDSRRSHASVILRENRIPPTISGMPSGYCCIISG